MVTYEELDINDKTKKYCRYIESNGQLINGYCSLNFSEIFTELIQSAGRFCECYASDMFYLLEMLESDIRKFKENKKYIFGLRDTGVDANDEVIGMMNDNIYYYRAVYIVKLSKTDSDLVKLELLRWS
jgi:hypothetical protein